MGKDEILEMLLELLESCDVSVNFDNMELYDESPDLAVDYTAFIKHIQEKRKK